VGGWRVRRGVGKLSEEVWKGRRGEEGIRARVVGEEATAGRKDGRGGRKWQ